MPRHIIGAMETHDELARALEELCAGGPVEVLEDGALVAELAGMRCDVRREGRHTLLHMWSEERNLVRRVVSFQRVGDAHLSVEVLRFGRAKPGKLELIRADRERPARRLAREKFRTRFQRLLAQAFPDEDLASLTSAADLEHSFSGRCARGVLRRGRRAWAVIGVSAAEDAATVDATLSFGLLWLDWTRQHAQREAVAGLRLLLPEGSSRVTAHRLQAILSSANIELYEFDEAMERVRRLDPGDVGNLETWLTPRREVEQTLAAAGEIVAKVRALDPEAIDAVVPPGTRDVAFRYRGLEFARWHRGELHYGLPDGQGTPGGSGWQELRGVVGALGRHRHAGAADSAHPLYRAQAERWLETLVLADPAQVDPHLDPSHLYSQVPAFSAGDRGVLDLLGVTRQGRLAVLELKAAEDLHLVLQAVDYWLRVRWHQRQGDFARYGYFAGKELQRQPARLLLVAPGLRFHSATEILLRYLIEEIEVARVGVNENWRKGIRVIFRR